MEITSEYFELAGELMEYLTQGDGSYPVDSSATKCKIISVKTNLARDDDGSVFMAVREDEPIQFFADISFVLQDESHGVAEVCLSPIAVMLLNFKKITLSDDENLVDKLSKLRDEIEENEPVISEENKNVWSKCLANYISRGTGNHEPNFIDSVLGMKQVRVYWTYDKDTNKLTNFGDDENLVYQCRVSYINEEDGGMAGSIVYRVMPYEINFFS